MAVADTVFDTGASPEESVKRKETDQLLSSARELQDNACPSGWSLLEDMPGDLYRRTCPAIAIETLKVKRELSIALTLYRIRS